MGAQNNGGSDFPVHEAATSGYGPHTEYGMSLRDYFAAHALTGVLAMSWHPEMGCAPPDGTPWIVADYAYRVADAMLKEREEA